MKRIRLVAILILITGIYSRTSLIANTAYTGMREISSMQLVLDMETGWNLGNSLDSEGPDETAWFNPVITKEMIDEVRNKGFKTLRLPVTWRFHMGPAPDYIIEKEWLDRVEEVANYAFENDMYVIINIHHDDPWIIPTYEKLDEVKTRLGIVWTQIANRFRDYGDYLIFETLNEPRYEGSPEEWSGGTEEGRDCVNQYHKVCLDAIRATGGNNATRHIMISTYAASCGDKAINDLLIPNYDEKTIVSLHNYAPYHFCLARKDSTWGTDEDKAELDAEFDKIHNRFIANGIAVVMGEWGALYQNNPSDRLTHAEYYANSCIQRGICPVFWDNGLANEFGIFNRKSITWNNPEIADAIINAGKEHKQYGNPFIKHLRAADPSAQVWDDGKVWVYASHDMDWAGNYSTMDGYHAFSSYDLVNWTDHGEILHSRDVSWGRPEGGMMFAPDAAYKDGTYYLYFPHLTTDKGWKVGVATSKTPEGPFTDIGRYIEGTDNIDPTCFIDDDGSAYLVWGGDSKPPLIAKLKDNMIELAEEPKVIEYGAENYGEGPYMHKYNGKYYFSYTCHYCGAEQSFYGIGDNPYGPFEYKGAIKFPPPGAQDHHSMIEYHGQWYYFYHTGNYGDQASLFRRNVCVDSMFYNEDGTIQFITGTNKGVGADLIGSTPGIIIPGKIEAEKYFQENGIEVAEGKKNAIQVTDANNSDWMNYVLDILGSDNYRVEIKISKPVVGTSVYLLVDEKVLDTILIDSKSDILKSSIFLNRGKHTLKLIFENEEVSSNLLNIDWINLQGSKKYYTISASSQEGGSIYPAGSFYIAEGDSISFTTNANAEYKIKNILIDGTKQNPADAYTFYNVSKNQSIQLEFEKCSTLSKAQIYLNDTLLSKSNINGFEGGSLKLEAKGSDIEQFYWIDPFKEKIPENTLNIYGIQPIRSGKYTIYYTDKKGCKGKNEISISVTSVELAVYEAEDWKEQSGVQNETVNDLGGGKNIGFIENGDWCTYNVTIDSSATYNLFVRVASGGPGGSIEVNNNGMVLGNINVDSSLSNGWQNWYTTEPLRVKLEEGEQEIKLSFKGGEGYLFNMNWFDLELSGEASN